MRPIILSFLLAMSISTAASAQSLNTIQLNNRPAAELIPIIEPLLQPGEAISGAGFKIFLRSSPTTLAEVQAVIDSLDVAAKTLMISVFQGSERELRNLSASGSIRIEKGSVSGDISAGSSRQQYASLPVHRLRVTEGKAGYIETGARFSSFGGSSSGEYTSATSGFYVLPRVQGDNVNLQISPFRNTPSRSSSGAIDTLQAQTTITGRLGEWLPLGGVSERFEQSHSDGVNYRSSQGSQQHGIWIKAERVR
jgi:type II secretory pathway component GspD/PulD (secretin)